MYFTSPNVVCVAGFEGDDTGFDLAAKNMMRAGQWPKVLHVIEQQRRERRRRH